MDLTLYAIGLALVVVLASILARKGGVDTGYILRVFAIFASLHAILLLVAWLVGTVRGEELVAAPSGADLVLLAGALVAMAYDQLEGLATAFSREGGKRSLLGRLAAAALPDGAVSWIDGVLGQLRDSGEVIDLGAEEPDPDEATRPPAST